MRGLLAAVWYLLQTAAGLAGVGLGCLLFVSSWQQAAIETTAERVKAGQAVPAPLLVEAAKRIEGLAEAPICNPGLVFDAALISVRMADEALNAGDTTSADDWLGRADLALRQSLACAPVDAFGWLALFKIAATRDGYAKGQLKFLEMSYDTGSREGWVVLKRNPLALAIFEDLPAGLQSRVVEEFRSILQSGLYQEALVIFTGSGWRVRDRILPALATLDSRHREAFALALARNGHNVEIPGVANPETRPWR